MYRIKDWEIHFENAVSLRTKHATWVPIKNKHDGKGYRRLASHPRAPEIFAAWILMLQLASKMPKRGVLADEDGPLDAQDMSDCTGMPVEIFSLALEVLSSERLGWIIATDKHLQTFTNVYEQAEGNRTEQKGTEQKEETSTQRLQQNQEGPESDLSVCPSEEVIPDVASDWHAAKADPRLGRIRSLVGDGRCKKEWAGFKRLIGAYGRSAVEAVLQTTHPNNRWPNKIEPELFENEAQKAKERESLANTPPLSDASRQALKVYKEMGAAKINLAMGWGDQSHEQITLGLSDELNAQDLLALVRKLAV